MAATTKEEKITNVESFFDHHVEQLVRDKKIFTDLYKQFLTEDAHIDWNSWKHIDENVKKNAKDVPKFDPTRQDVLDKLAVIKLNGGLGTTMGCSQAKSFIVIRDNLSFLDFAVLQNEHLNKKYNANVPLYLMNSFYTDKDTKKVLAEKNVTGVHTFVQSKCPRIDKNTMQPIDDESWGNDAWYPPGHGNIFHSLVNTGTLEKLLSEGKEIVFVSNIDNTGATLDLSIAQFMLDNNLEYIMECTEKTENDIKGGTLIEINGQLMHLEMPQVPEANLADFCSTKVFKIFNTNNIWVNLKAVKRLMPNIKSEIIVNHKSVRGQNVIQLETSIGGCIKNFKKAYCMHVDRDRFRPVKKLEDLLIISSNVFEMTDDFTLKLQSPTIPKVSLGKCFEDVQQLHERIPYPLNLKDATSLLISGDVKFGKNVKMRGDVIINLPSGVAKQIGHDETLVGKNCLT